MKQRAAVQPGGEDFVALYRGNVAEVYRYSLACVQDPADAEDVTQATFLAAFQELRRESPSPRTESWVLEIARRICRRRAERSLAAVETTRLDDLVGVGVEDADTLPAGLVSALHGIPRRERTALFLHDIKGLRCAEIAEELGLAEGTISRLLVRGRLNLRQQLATAMTCERARVFRSARHDHDLRLSESRAASEHLAHCPQCSTAGARSTGLFGPLALALFPLNRLGRFLASLARRGPHSSTDVLTGSAGTGAVVAKVVFLGASATVAGGLAWHAAAPGSGSGRTPVPRPAAVKALPGSHASNAAASHPAGTVARRRPGAKSLTPAPSSLPSVVGSSMLVPSRPRPVAHAAPRAAALSKASIYVPPTTVTPAARGRIAAPTAPTGPGSPAPVSSPDGPAPAPIAASGGPAPAAGTVVSTSGGTEGTGKATAPGQVKKLDASAQPTQPAADQAKSNPSADNRAAAAERRLQAGNPGHQKQALQASSANGAASASAQGAAALGATASAAGGQGNQGAGTGPAGKSGAPGKSGQSSTPPGKSGAQGRKGDTGPQAAAGAGADPTVTVTSDPTASTETTTDPATGTTDSSSAAPAQDSSTDASTSPGNGQGLAVGQQDGAGNSAQAHGKNS